MGAALLELLRVALIPGLGVAVGGLLGGGIITWRKYPQQQKIEREAAQDAHRIAEQEIGKTAQEIAKQIVADIRQEMEDQDRRHEQEIAALKTQMAAELKTIFAWWVAIGSPPPPLIWPYWLPPPELPAINPPEVD